MKNRKARPIIAPILAWHQCLNGNFVGGVTYAKPKKSAMFRCKNGIWFGYVLVEVREVVEISEVPTRKRGK